MTNYSISKEFSHFLDLSRTEKGGMLTHTTMHDKGRFYISRDNMQKFFEYYCDEVEKETLSLSFTECSDDFSPVVIDLDFAFKLNKTFPKGISDEDDTMLIGTREENTIISLLQESVKQYFDVTDDKMLTVVVTKKDNGVVVEEENKLKNGLHLMMPFCYMTKAHQKKYVHNYLIKEITKSGILEGLPLIHGIEKILDPNVTSINWTMYGSRRNPKSEYYKFVRAIDKDGEEINLDDLFDYHDCYFFQEGIIEEDFFLNLEKSTEYYLPVYLSVRSWGIEENQVNLKSSFEALANNLKKSMKNRRSRSQTDNEHETTDTEHETKNMIRENKTLQRRQYADPDEDEDEDRVDEDDEIEEDTLLSPTKIQKEIRKFNKERKKKRMTNDDSDTEETYDEMDLNGERKESREEVVTELISMLKPTRANAREDWLQVGWCLYNVTKKFKRTDFGLSLWIKFSKKSKKFKEGVCEEEWAKMTRSNMSMGTLHYLAKLDNPKKYKEMTEKCVDGLIQKCLKRMEHCDVANVLRAMFNNQFVCTSIKHNRWYMFNGNIWEETEEGTELSKHISGTLRKRFIDLETRINKQIYEQNATEEGEEGEDGGESEKVSILRARLKKLNKLIDKLGNHGFKTGVMKEAKELFLNKMFHKKLNSDPMLLGCENCIIDLNIGAARRGTPDDLVSKTTEVEFPMGMTEDHPHVKELRLTIKKMFIDEKERTMMEQLLGSVLEGVNRDKKGPVLTGGGHNAKSTLMLILASALGEYYISLPSSALTGKSGNSSSASPEMARSDGVRLIVISEPEAKEKINLNKYKSWTGGDKFFARFLHDQGKDITPLFKVFLVCNDPPEFPSNDQATWDRAIFIPFRSTFPPSNKNVPKTEAEQWKQGIFPCDKLFIYRAKQFGPAMLWLMLKWYNDYKVAGGIQIPESISEITEMYKNDNDFYYRFTQECVEDSEGSTMKIKELYTEFKTWYADNFNKRDTPKMIPTFRTSINRCFKVPGHRELWVGKALKIKKDDSDSDSDSDSDDEKELEFAEDDNINIGDFDMKEHKKIVEKARKSVKK